MYFSLIKTVANNPFPWYFIIFIYFFKNVDPSIVAGKLAS